MGIEHIIHQIWLGNNPRPVEWMQTVEDFATEYGYKYMIWTEDAISSSLMKKELAKVFKGYESLAGKADILRLAVLYKYGGVYIDADTVIMRPEKFDTFIKKNTANVFFGWENINAKRTRKLGLAQKKLVANGLIGAEKGHPFLKELLDGITDNIQENGADGEAWKEVGPLYVTQKYTELKSKYKDINIYPMKYFYPMHWAGITDPELHKSVKIPAASMLFQYGYSTNSFDKIFKKLRRRTRRRRQD